MENNEEYDFKEKGETNKDVAVIIIIILSLLLIALILYLSDKPQETLDDWTMKCISEKAIMISKQGCSACVLQKKILGDYIDDFEIMELNENNYLIEKYNITKIPTWIINNKAYEGKKTLDELRELTDCY